MYTLSISAIKRMRGDDHTAIFMRTPRELGVLKRFDVCKFYDQAVSEAFDRSYEFRILEDNRGISIACIKGSEDARGWSI